MQRQIRMAIQVLVFASSLVLSAPIHADDEDDSSTEEVEAPSGEATSPDVAQPPAEPSEPDEDDDGTSE
jgi:hypothetical protein